MGRGWAISGNHMEDMQLQSTWQGGQGLTSDQVGSILRMRRTQVKQGSTRLKSTGGGENISKGKEAWNELVCLSNSGKCISSGFTAQPKMESRRLHGQIFFFMKLLAPYFVAVEKRTVSLEDISSGSSIINLPEKTALESTFLEGSVITYLSSC